MGASLASAAYTMNIFVLQSYTDSQQKMFMLSRDGVNFHPDRAELEKKTSFF